MFLRFRTLGFAALSLGLVAMLAACGGTSQSKGQSGSGGGAPSSITIATQDFSEPLIDSYMVKDLLNAKDPSIKVTITKTSGASGLMHNLMDKNDIQLYVGYDGTEFSGPLKGTYSSKYRNDPSLLPKYVHQQELKKWNVWTSPSLGYQDTYALAVRAQTAQKYNLKTVSDVVPYASKWTIATDPTFQARKGDGYKDWEKMYGLHFKSAKAMAYNLIYPALHSGSVQAAVVYSTDGRLKKLHEVPLTDNKHFFPPYHAIILMNNSLVKNGHINKVLSPLYGAISTAQQTELNYEVDVQKKSASSVAMNFLKSQGLLK